MKIFFIVCGVIVGLFVLYFLFAFICANLIFNSSLQRKKEPKPKKKKHVAVEEGMKNTPWGIISQRVKEFKEKETDKAEIVTIQSNGLKLSAYIYNQNKDSNLWIITSHGWTSNALSEVAISGPFFYYKGYNILACDHQAHGLSEGKVIGFGVQDQANVLNWIKYLNEHYNSPQIFLWGVSMGASTVLYTCDKDLPSNVKGIIADCGFTSPYEEFTYVLTNHMHLPKWPFMSMMWFVTKVRGKYDIHTSTIDCVKHSKVPLLFIGGKKDNFVPYPFTKANYDAANCEKELMSVEEAGHAMSYYYEPERYEKTVEDFIAKYYTK